MISRDLSSSRRARSVALSFALIASFVLAVADHASAQQPTDPTVRARELYQEGRRLGEQGRWEEACATFERALALRDAPLLHFALGTARAEVRRFVGARDSLRRFLATASDDASRAQIPAAQAVLRSIEPRIAHLTIRVSGGTPHAVRLDDRSIDVATLGTPIDVDPGERSITVVPRAGAAPLMREVRLSEGASDDVTIELVGAPTRGGRTTIGGYEPGDDRATGGGGIFSQWWFWTAVGVVVVGATVGVVVATQSGSRDPFAGDAPGGALETLRLP